MTAQLLDAMLELLVSLLQLVQRAAQLLNELVTRTHIRRKLGGGDGRNRVSILAHDVAYVNATWVWINRL